MDLYSAIYSLKNSGFITYFITFILIFTATYYLFLIIPLFRSDPQRKKLALVMSFAIAFIFISNERYIEAVHTTIQDYSYVIIMVVLIALIVASILYIGANYNNDN